MAAFVAEKHAEAPPGAVNGAEGSAENDADYAETLANLVNGPKAKKSWMEFAENLNQMTIECGLRPRLPKLPLLPPLRHFRPKPDPDTNCLDTAGTSRHHNS